MDVVAFSVTVDAGQFGIPALTNTSSSKVSFLFRVNAVFVAEVALPAASASPVDSRYHYCDKKKTPLISETKNVHVQLYHVRARLLGYYDSDHHGYS